MKAHKMKRWGFSLKAFSLFLSNLTKNHAYVGVTCRVRILIIIGFRFRFYDSYSNEH